MKRLKLISQITSCDCMKFRVENGMAMVAVQPCLLTRASDVHTPSHPGSPSPVPVSVRCSSVISASRWVPRGLTEDVSVTPIVSRVDDDLEVVIQLLAHIPPQLSGDNSALMGIKAGDTERDLMPAVK